MSRGNEMDKVTISLGDIGHVLMRTRDLPGLLHHLRSINLNISNDCLLTDDRWYFEKSYRSMYASRITTDADLKGVRGLKYHNLFWIIRDGHGNYLGYGSEDIKHPLLFETGIEMLAIYYAIEFLIKKRDIYNCRILIECDSREAIKIAASGYVKEDGRPEFLYASRMILKKYQEAARKRVCN